MSPSNPQIIQELVAPAVMIPASALLLLSSTARMNVVLSRIRTFHREQLEVWCAEPEPASRAAAVRSTRLAGLEHQIDGLLRRAALLRATMLMLFLAIGCNLLSMIFLGLRYLEAAPGGLYELAVGAFLLGVLLLFAALVTSVLEVAAILQTLRYEHDRTRELVHSEVGGRSIPGAVAPVDLGEGTGL
ncbi:MAG: DUF2721 domain-containing protein [Phycisphaerales bacterium]